MYNNKLAVYLRYLSVKISIFAIICILGAFIMGQIKTQSYDGIVFPGPDNSRTESNLAHGNPLISVDLAKRLNSIATSEDFLQLLQGVPQRNDALVKYSELCVPLNIGK